MPGEEDRIRVYEKLKVTKNFESHVQAMKSIAKNSQLSCAAGILKPKYLQRI